LESGRLSDFVMFQRKVVDVTAEGRRLESWVDDFEEWAEVERQGVKNYRFVIRYRRFQEGIVWKEIGPETHRILFDQRRWTITAALADRRRSLIAIHSDGSDLIEATHLDSEYREYREGLPDVRPPAPGPPEGRGPPANGPGQNPKK
jgi:head-tail adaptor